MSVPAGGHDTPGARPAVYLVARREILIRVRSRVFTVGTVVIVALIAIGVLLVTLLSGKNAEPRVGFAGPTQALAQPFAASAAAFGTTVTVSDITDAAAGEGQVRNGALDVLVTGTSTAPVAVVKGVLPPALLAALDAVAKEQALNDQLTAAGLDPHAVAAALAQVNIQVQSLLPVDPERTQKALLGIVVGFALYMALGFYGNFVTQGVVEEKATRMVEIILATVRPSALLTGKLVGIGLVGILQLAIVGVAAFALVAVTHVVTIPALGAVTLFGDLVWFVLGFFMYATAFAAAASLVSRQEEVASATTPISVFLVLSFLLVYVVVPDPSSRLATVLSLLPPFAPVLMPVRMATGDAAAWQVALAMLLTLATAGVLTWLAGRIYANSVLRLGARVRVMEALRGR